MDVETLDAVECGVDGAWEGQLMADAGATQFPLLINEEADYGANTGDGEFWHLMRFRETKTVLRWTQGRPEQTPYA